MKYSDNLIIIIKLAWRSVWKNKRRTILTLLTVMISTAMIIVLNAIATGGHEQMINDATEANVGHIQIHEKGFWENQTIDYAFKDNDALFLQIKNIPGVKAISKRIHAAGLVSNKDITAGVFIQGIDPEEEASLTSINKKIGKNGRYLSSEDTNQILLGKTLAKNLEVALNDSISIISQGFDGSIAAENLKIVGIFNSGNPEYDRALIIMPINLARETFSMLGNINSITLITESTNKIPLIKKEIKKIIANIYSAQNNSDFKTNFEILDWTELMPELVQFIVMDDVGAYIFDFVLLMVVAFGILNTIQMSIFERTRELGIMLAIGTKPGQLRLIIIIESLFITLMGISLGIFLGAVVSYYLQFNPMDYSAYADEMAIWGVSTTLIPARLTALNIIITSGLIFTISIFAILFPANRASKLKPIEAIKHL